MKKMIILIILSFYLTGCDTEIINVFQEKENSHVEEICGSKKIGQTFYYNGKDISEIEILMANYCNRQNTKDIIFHFGYLETEKIFSISDLKTLRTLVINASQIKDNEYFSFQFPAVKTNKNKKYFFYLESPESYSGNAITLYYQDDNVYKNGVMIIDNNETNFDMAFKISGKSGFFNILKNIGKDFGKKASKDTYFIILYVILLIIIIGILIKIERK
ncbi:MAG: hypothetical protein ABIB46_05135 [bacterium]